MPMHDRAVDHIAGQELTGVRMIEPRPDYGIAVTPFALVVDAGRIRVAEPIPTAEHLLDLIRVYT